MKNLNWGRRFVMTEREEVRMVLGYFVAVDSRIAL